MSVVIETARLSLRRLSTSDVPFILRLLKEPSFLQHIGDRGVRTREDAARYIESGPLASYERHGFGLYLVELKDDGTPIGICGVVKRDELPDVDIGFSLLPEFWSQGLALEAARAVKAYARETLGFRQPVAIVAPGMIRLGPLCDVSHST